MTLFLAALAATALAATAPAATAPAATAPAATAPAATAPAATAPAATAPAATAPAATAPAATAPAAKKNLDINPDITSIAQNAWWDGIKRFLGWLLFFVFTPLLLLVRRVRELLISRFPQARAVYIYWKNRNTVNSSEIEDKSLVKLIDFKYERLDLSDFSKELENTKSVKRTGGIYSFHLANFYANANESMIKYKIANEIVKRIKAKNPRIDRIIILTEASKSISPFLLKKIVDGIKYNEKQQIDTFPLSHSLFKANPDIVKSYDGQYNVVLLQPYFTTRTFVEDLLSMLKGDRNTHVVSLITIFADSASHGQCVAIPEEELLIELNI